MTAIMVAMDTVEEAAMMGMLREAMGAMMDLMEEILDQEKGDMVLD